MSLDTFKSILLKVKWHKNVDLNLFGGEPLLNNEIMEYILSDNFVIQKNIVRLSINTNGLLFSQKLIDFTFANREVVRIDLSIDGNREIHDYHRRDYGGNGSYDEIMEKIRNIKDFSNYTINFCVSSFASDKLAQGVNNLVKKGFTNIKLMFLYEQNWNREDFKNLIGEFMKLKKYQKIININVFNFYIDTSVECKQDFISSFSFLPSGEVILCPVWISKKAHKVKKHAPFFIDRLEDKLDVVNKKIFGDKELSATIEEGPICEGIQGAQFKKNKKIIEGLINKIF